MAEINLGRVKGADGVSPPLSDSVTSSASGVAASSLAVKTAYDRANFSLGLDQTWQNVSSSRSLNTEFVNSQDRSILVSVKGSSATLEFDFQAIVGGIAFVRNKLSGVGTSWISFEVPPGNTYQVISVPVITNLLWNEYR